jgi:hypothetical protein
MVRPVIISFILAAGLFLSCCGDPINTGKIGDSCRSEAECSTGLVCDCATLTCVPTGESSPACRLPDANLADAAEPDGPSPDHALQDGTHADAGAADGASVDALFADGATQDASP